MSSRTPSRLARMAARTSLDLTDEEQVRLAQDLRRSVTECRDRGLYQAAKWSGELLASLPASIRRQASSAGPTKLGQPSKPRAHRDGLRSAVKSGYSAASPSSLQTPPPADPSALRDALDDLPPPPPFARGSRSRPTSNKRARSGLGAFWTPVDEGNTTEDMSMSMDLDMDAEPPNASGSSSKRAVPSISHSTPISDKIESPEANMVDVDEEDDFALAKAYFEAKELDRCRAKLADCKCRKSVFLRMYATYLSADKKAQELLPHYMDSTAEMAAITPHIQPLLAELGDETDPYLLYLKGMLHFRLGQRDLALECFIRSVTDCIYNWSCWLSIANCIQSAEQYTRIKHLLPPGIMLAFFAISVMLDLHSATDVMLGTIAELQKIFPTSIHLKACKALVYYHMRDFDDAEKAFDEVRALDPYRLEEIEIYSNMLYVMNKKAKLGQIAHEYAQIDENRAEVCCLIGNYFSSRDEHVKAIQFFKRSLQLNRDYLPAWTLMGHEFVELKNSHAAIEAYRRAIDVNPKDYRAWYGLGQTYELLDMPFYAIQYYNRATALRPYDCRMWSALATVYEHLKRVPEAIQCNSRALLGADAAQTLGILLKLAQLHDALGHHAQAADAHRRHIMLAEREERDAGEMAQSYLYVAQYDMDLLHRDRETAAINTPEGGTSAADDGKDVKTAVFMLEKVIASDAPEKEAAEEDLRYLRKKYGAAIES